MSATVSLMFVAIALIAGVVVGWWLASRTVAPLTAERDQARAEAESCRIKLHESLVNLAAEAEKTKRLGEVEAQLANEREIATSLRAQVAAFQRGEEERERAHQDQVKQLGDLKTQFEEKFSQLAGQALETAHTSFLKRANEKLEATGAENEQKLKNVLQPVEATLKRYEQSLGDIEKARNDSYGALKEAVAQLAQGNEIVRKETQRLANVMVSSPKHRGRWGEEHLKNILESAGLAENIDFELQTSVSDGERKLRPDCIINLPNNRCIVVDVKNVWTAFEQAYDEEDLQRKSDLLKKHADAMEVCAKDLSRKGYWKQFERSPDFVVMFIPGEHILSAAAERAPDMIAEAFSDGVIIASTINMLALAKFFAGMWRQESLAAQAKEIAALGKELHARLQTMGGHVVSLGRNLRLATDSYDDFIGSLDKKVLTQAKRFEELKVADGNKSILDPQRIDFTPKVSAKLPLPSGDEHDAPQIDAKNSIEIVPIIDEEESAVAK